MLHLMIRKFEDKQTKAIMKNLRFENEENGVTCESNDGEGMLESEIN